MKKAAGVNKPGKMPKAECRQGQKIIFEAAAAPGSEVFWAGRFSSGDPKQYQMYANPDTGVYQIALALPPGRHEYKFVVNGEWCVDSKYLELAPKAARHLNSFVSA